MVWNNFYLIGVSSMKYVYEKKGLWFHYLIIISLLASMVVLSIDFTSITSSYDNLSLFGQVIVAYHVITIVLSLIAFFGLLNWHKLGWYSIIIVKALGIVLNMYIDINNLVSSYEITKLHYKICFSLIVIIYYFRRKPLFFPNMLNKKNNDENTVETNTHKTE